MPVLAPRYLWSAAKDWTVVPTGRKQGCVDILAVEWQQCVEAVGQSKDNMVVGNGKKFVFPFHGPSLPIGGLALGAMPVAAGVVTDRLFTAVTAFTYMPSQCTGPAQG